MHTPRQPCPVEYWGTLGAMALALLVSPLPAENVDRLVIPGGPQGDHIVLVAGDEEYRSEEALPCLARILAAHHDFHCTVLFSQDREGRIDPTCQGHLPGLETLREADLLVIFTRFRHLPPEQMAHLDDYLRRGRPVIGIRTATHAFSIPPDDPYHYFSHDCQLAGYEGGFGRQVLGETWIAHHGEHGRESTRARIARGAERHPILHGVQDGKIWGPTDVYRVRLPLPETSQVLLEGEVLAGMTPESPAVLGTRNAPRMPIAWTRTYRWRDGPPGRAFVITMGAAEDFQSDDLRRVLVNACYWALHREEKLPPCAEVSTIGKYEPSPFGFGRFRPGQTIRDLAADLN